MLLWLEILIGMTPISLLKRSSFQIHYSATEGKLFPGLQET